ncbi:MAG TPA: TAXI family TRAP transporter solute-binding subunit [Candidatus Methylomirabilis sp.]|nr:TAXI family TRAP transporter solute-binding subunit [Candidatus Methylomirabilis sp.]HSC70035.1 TAXI family TRAP transporter solute-binding subunit [Candidatus Methylomirabilis sp.]
MRSHRWGVLAVVVMLFGVWLYAPASAAAQQKPVNLTWTAGPVGGGWYLIAGGIAELIRDAAGFNVKVVPGGGTQNPPLIDKGEAELGWGLPPLLNAAWNGEDPYDKPPNNGRKMQNLRSIAGGMSVNTFHFYVGAETPFKSMDEIFKQKKALRIAISPVGTSDEWVFRKVMAYYGTDYRDLEAAGFKFFRGSYSEQASNFKDRNVDAVFTFLALPGAAVTEASLGRSLRLLNFPPGLLDSLAKFGLGKGSIAKGTYPKAANADEDVTSATMGSVIVANKDVPPDVAYGMAKAISENLDRFRKIHASLQTYQASNGAEPSGIPLHPGAEKYFREKGYLK